MPVWPSGPDALRVWNLFNWDTLEEIRGQFHAEELAGEVASAYSEKFSLNRQHAITQFLHGEVETLSFRARLYAATAAEEAQTEFDKIKSWARRDESLGRPPVLEFWAGDGLYAYFVRCILQSVSGIAYDRPTFFGGLRHVTFTLNLREYKDYSIEATPPGDTRYHRARLGDYYEMLTYREYGDPMLGDVIRKIHPTKPNVQVGDTIKLPSAKKLRTSKTTQTSIPLETGFGRKATPQRDLRVYMFAKRNRSLVSYVLRA